MFERYTERARRAIFFARYEASQFGSPYIETEHLLLGLLREDDELANRFLRSDLSIESIRKQIEGRTTVRGKVSTSVDLPLSVQCKRVLNYAAEEAERLSNRHIRTEHLLLGLMREEKCLAAELLRQSGLDLGNLRRRAAETGVDEPPTRPYNARALLAAAGLYRAQGALWGAGYVRKTETASGKFCWEKRLSAPWDALVKRSGGGIVLYTGQAYDGTEFELVKDAWQHDACMVCWKMIYLPTDPGQSYGFTNGQYWLCAECYEAFVAGQAGR